MDVPSSYAEGRTSNQKRNRRSCSRLRGYDSRMRLNHGGGWQAPLSKSPKSNAAPVGELIK
eukprot:4713165-Heterocapsa_arctica.AAC.1